MEDNFDTILYIIIALIAFVISALGKKKKKQEPVNSGQSLLNAIFEDETPAYNEFEKIFNTQNSNEENKQIIRQVPLKVEKATKTEGKSQFIEKNSPLTKNYIKSSVVEGNNEIYDNSISSTDIQDDLSDENLEEFDLRDAIIYSEILNRKSY